MGSCRARAFIFDFGGTLAFERDAASLRAARADLVCRVCVDLADAAVVAAAWREVLAELRAAERGGTPVSAVWAARRVVDRLDPSAVDWLVDALAVALVDPPDNPQSLGLVPGATDLLAWLRHRGVACGILSNTGLSSGTYDRAWLHSSGIADAFVADAVVFSDELGIGKPARAAFEACLQRLGHAAHDVVHVGDSPWFDVIGAGGCGLRTVLCTSAIPGDAPVGADADLVVDDLALLPRLLEAW